jgi:hypothetical protein
MHMTKYIALGFFCLLCVTVAQAQQTGLFFPRNLQRAYDKGTRSTDGKPGPNYWQNRANYNITVRLEPKTRVISGEETVTYINNSPDTLKTLRLKLQHDRYRKGAMRGYDVDAEDIDDGTAVQRVAMNGAEIGTKQQRRFATFLDLDLKNTPVLPKSTTTLAVSWSYTLPASVNAAREFVADSSVFFVPYWYPQVAVYDDLQGWADAAYNGTQEFYHEFGDYDVRVVVPQGFQVWATGEWQNATSILNEPYLSRWQRAHENAPVTAIFTENELKSGNVFRAGKEHTFQFVAKDVPDFAFAASSRYNWDAITITADPNTGRKTFISAVYDTKSTDYPQVAQIASIAIRLMGSWLPGYPFPYPSMTVFNGNDGMEYPMMCNDASTAPGSPMTLTVHEISHTYFPFMMGINEQDYAWMDEGWAAFFDYKLSDSLSGHKEGRVRPYSAIAGTENDVPPMVRSRNLTTAYRNAAYQRPSMAYFTLLDLLGYERFHGCMTTYMDTWKGKHPAPFDFFNTWSQASGENLDWFWKPWFFEWGYPDLRLKGVVKQGKKGKDKAIQIDRIGNIPVPIHVEVTFSDGSKATYHETAAIWKDGRTTHFIKIPREKDVTSMKMGLPTIPDVNAQDNVWKIL